MRRNGRDIGSVRVAVVGAGPAGLATSRRLARAGLRHVVLERGRIGWSWRTQRWDSFRLNTPLWANRVPGQFLAGPPQSFATAHSLVTALERFADGLPIVEGVEVLRARRVGDSWRIDTSRGSLLAGAVVAASGFQNVPRKPGFADALPTYIEQLHAADYRRPEDVTGAVLVVGGGQSGVQIAADLLDGGHQVYLSTSRVGRLPRRYRGRDAYEWLHDSGQLDLPRERADPLVIGGAPPQLSGAAGGRTVSYQQLANRGVTLLGRAVGWDGRRLELAPDLGANVWFADESSRLVRAAWERRAALANGEGGPEGVPDPADEPAPGLYDLDGPSAIDLAAEGISTIIWTTGFGASTGWLPPGALDRHWRPRLPDLHVIGAPWLTHRSSGNLYGMTADAERLASALEDVDLGAAA